MADDTKCGKQVMFGRTPDEGDMQLMECRKPAHGPEEKHEWSVVPCWVAASTRLAGED